MPIKIIQDKISNGEIAAMAREGFGDFVKAVVDIEKGIMAIGGELHADEEALLLEQDLRQENLWGINIYPDKSGEDMIEFNSMINIRPWQNNRSRGVEDEAIREKIKSVVSRLING